MSISQRRMNMIVAYLRHEYDVPIETPSYDVLLDADDKPVYIVYYHGLTIDDMAQDAFALVNLANGEHVTIKDCSQVVYKMEHCPQCDNHVKPYILVGKLGIYSVCQVCGYYA